MIKKYVNKKKESDAYLASDSRHRRSPQIMMKVDKVCSFQSALQPSSVLPLQLMKAVVPAESYI